MAEKVTVGIKSAGPAASHDDRQQVSASNSKIVIRWPSFMLKTPKPADKD